MRDLRTYPITTEEILDLLSKIRDGFLKEDAELLSVGDMRALILSEAMKRIKELG